MAGSIPWLTKFYQIYFNFYCALDFIFILVILINMCVIPFMFLCITMCVESHSTPAMGWGPPMATGSTTYLQKKT